MEIKTFGVNFTHRKGEFCRRNILDCFVVCRFSTPFLYESNGILKEGHKGEMLIMSPGNVVYHGPVSENEIFVNDWMYVYGEDFEELLKKYPLPLNMAFDTENINYLGFALKNAENELIMKQTGYKEKINCCITECIIDIFRSYNKLNNESRELLEIETARIKMLKSFDYDWTLFDLSQLVGYSESHFSALYKKRFNTSPKADLIKYRIEQAKNMLTYGTLSISEISAKCGFKSIYYFSKYFKKITGYSPSSYNKPNLPENEQ